MGQKLGLKVGTATQQKSYTGINEDCLLSLPEHHIFAVCDGVGGATEGDVAAQLACKAIERAVPNISSSDTETIAKAKRGIQIQIYSANSAIKEYAKKKYGRLCMGSTIVMAYLIPGEHSYLSVIGYVGDSRAYSLVTQDDPPQFTCLTLDDSHIRMTLRDGKTASEWQKRLSCISTSNELTEHGLALWNRRHVLTQNLGIPADDLDPHATQALLEPGDRLLLCSDGLESLTDHQKEEILKNMTASPQETANRLIEATVAANMAQPPIDRARWDDITVIVIEACI